MTDPGFTAYSAARRLRAADPSLTWDTALARVCAGDTTLLAMAKVCADRLEHERVDFKHRTRLDRESDEEGDAITLANATALSLVLAETRLQLAPDVLRLWRPTVRATGQIAGLEHEGTLTLVATDGVRGVFLRPTAPPTEYLMGHVAWFTGEVKTLFGRRKEKPAASPKKPRKSRKSLLDAI